MSVSCPVCKKNIENSAYNYVVHYCEESDAKMSEIKIQVVGKDFKYFFIRNKGSEDQFEQDKIKKEIDSALKLQELVKTQILYESELNEGFNDYEKTALFLLETLVEESEKVKGTNRMLIKGNMERASTLDEIKLLYFKTSLSSDYRDYWEAWDKLNKILVKYEDEK